jgi:hypothetical protein
MKAAMTCFWDMDYRTGPPLGLVEEGQKAGSGKVPRSWQGLRARPEVCDDLLQGSGLRKQDSTTRSGRRRPESWFGRGTIPLGGGAYGVTGGTW